MHTSLAAFKPAGLHKRGFSEQGVALEDLEQHHGAEANHGQAAEAGGQSRGHHGLNNRHASWRAGRGAGPQQGSRSPALLLDRHACAAPASAQTAAQPHRPFRRSASGVKGLRATGRGGRRALGQKGACARWRAGAQPRRQAHVPNVEMAARRGGPLVGDWRRGGQGKGRGRARRRARA